MAVGCSTLGCSRNATTAGGKCSDQCQGPVCCVPNCQNLAKRRRLGWKCDLNCSKNSFIREVLPGTPKYIDLVQQLRSKWPAAGEIYKIYSVRDRRGPLEQAHQAYCNSLGSTGAHGKGQDPGNQQRRYHATRSSCDFRGEFCQTPTCPVCSIIKNGFDLGRAGNGSFGRALYSSSQPSKSFNFNQKSMFIVNVACGVVEKSQSNGALQVGCHSRVADLANGDELMVFDGRAMVPRYLLVWK